MESDKADTDTQLEVDIMILDYLLCISIDTVLHGRKAKRLVQTENWDADWVLNSVHTFRSIIPTNHTLALDLRIKLQLLDFANRIFCGRTELVPYKPSAPGSSPEPGHTPRRSENFAAITSTPDSNNSHANAYLSKIIPEFMKLCTTAKERVSGTRWVEITTQFMIQAAAEEYHLHGNQLPETFKKCLSWEPNDRDQALRWQKASAECMSYLQAPRGTSLDARIEAISNEWSLSRLEGTVIDFLCDLMKTLDPPVLVQLEKGQLGKLNHAETEQLRNRVGL